MTSRGTKRSWNIISLFIQPETTLRRPPNRAERPILAQRSAVMKVALMKPGSVWPAAW